ncbi:MAG: hypothetical protein CM15mP32_0700 [Flavobacteriaceae bacterium]|nr:MAG: hypothetical protein CM15mP32_0700 [Flavobacteriaceae bacterium]
MRPFQENLELRKNNNLPYKLDVDKVGWDEVMQLLAKSGFDNQIINTIQEALQGKSI